MYQINHIYFLSLSPTKTYARRARQVGAERHDAYAKRRAERKMDRYLMCVYPRTTEVTRVRFRQAPKPYALFVRDHMVKGVRCVAQLSAIASAWRDSSADTKEVSQLRIASVFVSTYALEAPIVYSQFCGLNWWRPSGTVISYRLCLITGR